MIRLRSAFDCVWFASPRSLRDLVAGDQFQESAHQLVLFLAGPRLCEGVAKLPQGADGAFEAEALELCVVSLGRIV